MQRFLTIAIVCVGSLFGSVAVAQDETAPIPTEFYKMDGSLLEGGVKSPSGMLYGGLSPAVFERYIRLKKSFLPKIGETSKDGALK